VISAALLEKVQAERIAPAAPGLVYFALAASARFNVHRFFVAAPVAFPSSRRHLSFRLGDHWWRHSCRCRFGSGPPLSLRFRNCFPVGGTHLPTPLFRRFRCGPHFPGAGASLHCAEFSNLAVKFAVSVPRSGNGGGDDFVRKCGCMDVAVVFIWARTANSEPKFKTQPPVPRHRVAESSNPAACSAASPHRDANASQDWSTGQQGAARRHFPEWPSIVHRPPRIVKRLVRPFGSST
jgi:hypothetical protein